ncbi:MAG: hypothetical protein SPL67_02665 [Prevotella sp.]|nr:hypothetical protein [Prevotella sp.]
MDEETLRQKLRYAGTKNPSMTRRKQDHDYRSRQIYLITMVTEGRLPLFGHIEGDAHQPYGHPQAPHIVPTPLGTAIIDNWQGMTARIPE